MRSKVVVGNWKLNGSLTGNEALLGALLREITGKGSAACAVCVPYPYLAQVQGLLEGSAIIESHRWCDKVQDAYSLRCAPQVHGASRDLLDYCDYTVSVELNAATDNPLVLVDDRARVGGNLALGITKKPQEKRRQQQHRDGVGPGRQPGGDGAAMAE